MSKNIDAEKLKKKLLRRKFTGKDLDGHELSFNDGIMEAISVIDEMKTTDVRPERHGRWDAAGDIVVECSACGEVYSAIMIPRHYCPNCGAKMDREESDLDGKINIS